MRWSHVISRRVLLTTVLAGLSVSACKETVTEPIVVASVTVTGGGGTLRLGQSTQLTTTLKSTEGWTLPNVGVSWTSSDAAKATISPSGQVTALTRGPATLTASASGVTGTGAVTVIGVQSIALAPETLSVIVTQTRPMTATTVLDAGVTVTPTWRSLDTTIAKVDTAGRVTAKSMMGLARIEVTAEDKKDTAVVRVIPVPVVSIVVTPDTATRGPGQAVQLTATPKDSIGGTLTGRAVTWSSSDASKATVSTTGLVTGVATGSAVITATIEGKTATSNITIRVPINEITLTQSSCTGSGSQSGNTARLYTTETCQYSATPRDASGNTLLGRNLAWSVSDTTVAKLDGAAFAHPTTQLPTVKLLPQKGGTANLTVTGEGKSATITVNILSPVSSISINPSAVTIAVGASQQFTATPKDADGNALTSRSITWTLSDNTKATVSSTGLVTALAPGSAILTASSEGKSSTVTVSITTADPPIGAEGLVAYYPLDGTAQSTISTSQNGELFGALWNYDRKGKANGAVQFNGGTSVRIPGSVLNNLSSGSFAMWIRWDSVTTYQVIFAKVIGSSAATYYFTLNGCTDSNGFPTGGAEPGQICWHSQNYSANPAYVASNGKLVRGIWSHVAVTWDAGSISLYLNGVLDKSVSCTGCGILDNSTVGTTLGGWSPTENIGDLRGSLDELRVYNRKLTQSEVVTLATDNRPLIFSAPTTPTGDVAEATIFKIFPNRGSHERVLASGLGDILGVLSPSGDSVAFSSNRHCQPCAWYQVEVHVASVTGGGLRMLSNNLWSAYGKAWSPNGQSITFESQGGTALPSNLRIYTSSMNGLTTTKISTEAYSRFPDWSPDGNRILYYVYPSSIKSMKIDGTDVRTLRSVSADAMPRWSPDGSKIVFTEGNNIWTMNADGTGAQAIVTLSTNESAPAWSPDGRRIAFLSDRSGDWQIWSTLIDGTELIQITTMSGGLRRVDPFSWR